ncbi:uncharacterized protein KQ657_004637 [Scheffersomyces spartinae]|uniref:FAD-binding FR-type domain-containing protein n=1 Tax=Scheffersomyces spartinae TaxID=45513 RepID=A0A9P7VBS7_9ASCO|nr:uncharacterized protein KQ657_004637 [Scheffersomyces spartinae]KAG7194424.1 hypothetical protein KQ657_004637 [Scheffersomyces spartinae]
MVSLSVIIAATLLLTAAAHKVNIIYHNRDIAVKACSTYLTRTATLHGKKDKKGFCNVKAQQALGSMANCLHVLNQTGSIDSFLDSCKHTNLTRAQFDAAYLNASTQLVNTTAVKGFNTTKLFYQPIITPKKKIRNYKDSIGTRFINFNYASWYGIVLIGYWFALVLVSGFFNFLKFAAPNFVQSLNSRIVTKYRKYVTVPATGSKHHAEIKTYFKVFSMVVPTRAESLMIFGWVVLAIIFNCVSYHSVSPNTVWKYKYAEMGRKIADRTGVMSLYLIPPTVLFAGRNNLLQWISGWKYQRFLILHRWVARVTTLLFIVHAVGMTFNGRGIGKYQQRNGRPYVRWGYVGTIAACLMCFQGLIFLRRKAYEYFLLGHIVLGVLYMVGGYLHVEKDGYHYFYMSAFCLWALDRVLRLVRCATFGVKPAEVELIGEEMMRVTVDKPTWWKAFPGCHAFVSFMRPSCFWQSHPFTVLDSVDGKLVFLIRVKGGVSHGLYKFLSKQPNQRATIKVSIEGPYGAHNPSSRYNNTVFVGGGNGIVGLYSIAMNMAKKSKASQRIKIHWGVRNYLNLQWFYNELQQLSTVNVDTTIYVSDCQCPINTRFMEKNSDSEEDEKSSGDEKSGSDHVSSLKASLPHIEFVEGRPNAEQIVQNEISQTISPIAFTTCAHPAFVDDVRKAVVNNMDKTKQRVDLFEEIQVW